MYGASAVHLPGNRKCNLGMILKKISSRLYVGKCHFSVSVSRISRQPAHKGGKVVSTRQQPPLAPIRYPWYSFLLEGESTPGP